MVENIAILWSLLVYGIVILILGSLTYFSLPWLGKGPMQAFVEINVKSILLEFEQRRLRAILLLCITFIMIFLIPLIADTSHFPFIEIVMGLGVIKAFTVILYPITYRLPNSDKVVVVRTKTIDKILSQDDSTAQVGCAEKQTTSTKIQHQEH